MKLSDLKKQLEQHGSQEKSGNDLFWYEPPVSPKEFIESPKFYGNSVTHNVYSWVIDDLEEIFSGDYHAPKYTTVVEIAGTGSGKTMIAAMGTAYLVYWIQCFKSFSQFLKTIDVTWDDAATIGIFNMATNSSQAKDIVFERVTGIINRITCFNERDWMPDSRIRSELVFWGKDQISGKPFRKISLVPGSSKTTFALGHSLIAATIDEAAFWKTKDGDPAEKVYKVLKDRIYSRFKDLGVIFLISSANVEDDYLERLWAKGDSGEDQTIFARRRARYHCKPEFFNVPTFDLPIKLERSDGEIEEVTLKPPVSLRNQYEEDIDQALRNIEAIPTIAGCPFFKDFIQLLANVNKDRIDPCPDLGHDNPESPLDVQTRLPGWFTGQNDAKYFIHIDLSKGNILKGHCGTGFAMSHKMVDSDGAKVKLDLSVRFKTNSREEIDINELLNFILFLKDQRNFNIVKVTFDQWQSLGPKQTINSWGNGIVAEELKVDYEKYNYFKSIAYTQKLDLFYDNHLFFELKRLEDWGTTITAGNNSTKDEADAAVGSCYSAAFSDGKFEKSKPRATRGRVVGGGALPARKPFRGVGNYRTVDHGIPKYRQY